MKKLLLKTMLLLCALVAGMSSAWADEATISYSGSSTGNMDGSNQASLVGLNNTDWSVIGAKGQNSNFPGLNKAGDIRLYYAAEGSNTITVTNLHDYTISSIVVTYTGSSYNNASIAVNGSSVTGTGTDTEKTYSINASSFVIGNANTSNVQVRISSIKINYSTSGGDSSAESTTTVISALGITNTDVYAGTEAGSLTATVKDESSNTVAGAAVTWSGDNDDVATIDPSTGAVTLVAAGVVNFTATYAGVTDTYAASSDTYEMTVTSSAPYVQPTEFDINMNNHLFGTSYTGTTSGITDENPEVGTQDNVIVTYAGAGNHYINDSQVRFYPNNKLTFEAPSGYNITKIVFTSAGTWTATISADRGTYTANEKTWAGEATSVVFTGSGSGRCDISKVTVTLASPSSVATPTFTVAAGTYSEAQNVKVSNYDKDYIYFYTTDETAPDCDSELNPMGNSLVYNHAAGIDVTATTTLKMIAVDIEGNKSSVATAAYTIQLPFTTIAEVKDLTNGTSFKLNLTGAQVVYIDDAKKNIYVRDASGAIVLYNNSGFSTSLTTGDILSGTIEGTYSPYKNLPEITNIVDISVLTSTGNSTVVAKTIAGTTEAIAANLCDLVKIEGTEITERSSKYYVGESSDIQLYDNFKVGYTVTTGKTVDVSGIATVYNTTYELFPRFESDIVYLDESEEIEISAAGVATFCSANALDFTAVDAIKVYTAKVEGGVVKLSQIHKVPAYEGVILMNALGMNEGAVDAVNVPYLDGDADNVSGNELVGITAATVVNAMSAGKYNYILSNEAAGVGFYRAVDGVQLAANKAYLSTTVNAAVRDFLGFTEGDSDAIIEIAKNEKMSAIYDLSGRRVVKPTKGLYIVNGKKVVK